MKADEIFDTAEKAVVREKFTKMLDGLLEQNQKPVFLIAIEPKEAQKDGVLVEPHIVSTQDIPPLYLSRILLQAADRLIEKTLEAKANMQTVLDGIFESMEKAEQEMELSEADKHEKN